ncbi:hypothetical protein TWF569_005340 [Orbilia oligospora]|nr:hypothetical protein TWF594_008404 [Orbilia oligospora]KAF3148854.1 hypothetical protein TWF569_005340 [Orbilia oligospora]
MQSSSLAVCSRGKADHGLRSMLSAMMWTTAAELRSSILPDYVTIQRGALHLDMQRGSSSLALETNIADGKMQRMLLVGIAHRLFPVLMPLLCAFLSFFPSFFLSFFLSSQKQLKLDGT